MCTKLVQKVCRRHRALQINIALLTRVITAAENRNKCRVLVGKPKGADQFGYVDVDGCNFK